MYSFATCSRMMDPLTTDLRNLNSLAKVSLYDFHEQGNFKYLLPEQIMRLRRIERGALTLASPEVKFEIDTETHDPLDIGTCLNYYSLFYLTWLNWNRRHPSPTKEMLEPLLQTAAAVGLDLDVSSSKALADSLDRAVAVYFSSGDLSPSEFSHYGLAARLYTHFTSPIRRYADNCIIRQDTPYTAIPILQSPRTFDNLELIFVFLSDLNHRHRNAQMASRASVELHTLIYFKKRYY
ncbi:hypothetical protein B296_00009845 [Ensete ventricosum]|uniref:RNB domain-containing protein n=1 Tax=Ensete ventricosum TaxID=4639 RepID=A0A427B5L4_ENSVE|nr:hypothetical protein B296_00009845 [Ensete ventricosum]